MFKRIIDDTSNAKLRRTKTLVPLLPMCALSARKGDQLCQTKVTYVFEIQAKLKKNHSDLHIKVSFRENRSSISLLEMKLHSCKLLIFFFTNVIFTIL